MMKEYWLMKAVAFVMTFRRSLRRNSILKILKELIVQTKLKLKMRIHKKMMILKLNIRLFAQNAKTQQTMQNDSTRLLKVIQGF